MAASFHVVAVLTALAFHSPPMSRLGTALAFHSPPLSQLGTSPTSHRASPFLSSASPASAASSGGSRLLSADKLSRANDGKIFQFESVSLQLLSGQRLGLVGPNGCGKSTLLKTLAQVERADAGLVERSRGARILYVEQEPPLTGTTIREAVYTGIEPDPSSTADAALRAAYQYHVTSLDAEANPAAFEAAASAAAEADCWEHDARARAICEMLGLSLILDKDVASCSGGERKRAGLAAALARQPDALLLDEPTNHLDGRAIQWLAELLTNPGSNLQAPAVLCVSHDRYFLEQVCSHGLLELDRGALHSYDWGGSYERYLYLKDERLAADAGVADRAKVALRREREWMSRQPQARQAKSVAREARYYKLEDKAAATGPASGAQLTGLAGMKRLGGKVLAFEGAWLAPELADASAREAAAVVRDFSFELAPRSRWGVVGPNGG
jgi:ATP-binding cassette subfamily F protein uup